MVSCVVFTFFYITQRNMTGEYPSYFVKMNVLSTIIGLTWSFIITSILIDLLTMVGIVAKLDTTYLGLTVLAVGNALPDSLTVVSLSKKGYAIMGITGVYAGYFYNYRQLFGLLVGFGFAMLKKCLIQGPQVFIFYSMESLIDIMVVGYIFIQGVVFITLIYTIVYSTYNKFVFDRKMMYVLAALYIIFIVASTAI